MAFRQERAKPLAGILTGAQHEKDGKEGLNVRDKRGNAWIAYGDGLFFTPKNEENRARVIAATQESVNEVYGVYQHPDTYRNENVGIVEELIPEETSFNSLPLYEVKDKMLILYQGNEEIQIRSKEGIIGKVEGMSSYLSKAVLSQALRYLPEEYIRGFLQPFQITLPPIVEKVLIPQIEQLTGRVWHAVGLATYYQVRQETEQLNAKIDEMADIMIGTYNNTVKILQELKKIREEIAQQTWFLTFGEISKNIATMENAIRSHQRFGKLLDDRQKLEIEDTGWRAYNAIAGFFERGVAANGIELLLAYQELQRKEGNTPEEVKLLVTLWFQQMLESQITAFNLYGVLRVMRDKNEEQTVRAQLLRVERSLQLQIEQNKHYINTDLICTSSKYISRQLEQVRVIKTAFDKIAIFNASNKK